ncbi:hypothetical protein GGX14DRAFT_577919 [Mycena pura]|uniref:Uncharacterized protein n=1 Tax=Mycena pura TaxID=153505 RepID=A0AAD6UQM8_9AGAR|nr:hypothetical protein GGX14DRAFT_577919 [Mycena pura]
MVRYVRGPGPRARISCVADNPTLKPGDTLDSLSTFFAVLSGQYAGIYIDFTQIVSVLRLDPNSHCICDKSLAGIFATWRAFCEEHHDHESTSGSFSASHSSSPTYSAGESAFDTSPCPSPTHSRRSSLDGLHPDLPPLETSTMPHLPPKRPLRSPPPSSTFSHLPPSLRAMSPRPAASFSPNKGSSNLLFPTSVHTSMPAPTPFPTQPYTPHASRCTSPQQYKHRQPGGTPAEPPAPSSVMSEGTDCCRVFYAISVCNRLLVSRSRAFKLFSATEGAVMLLAGSLSDAAAFFERTSGPHGMYAVSGERKVFRDREHAFSLFLQKAGAQMLFSNDPETITKFIREHVSL